MENKKASRERWIVCPACGRKLQKTRLTLSEIKCECGEKLTVLAKSGFVTILLDADDEVSVDERIHKYCAELKVFTD